MGKSSTEIQYDLERQRNAIEARITRLNRRLREDAETVKEEVKQDLDRTVGPESKAAEHPKALMAGAAGTGVVLGMLSSSVSLRPRLPHRNGGGKQEQSSQHDEGGGQSRKQRLAGVAAGSVTSTLTSRLDNLISDVWESFTSGFKSETSSDLSDLPPDVRSSRAPRTASAVPGGSAAGHGERYLSREEISPHAVDADMALKEGEKSPDEILHEARAEDYAPRENMPAYSGIQGEGLLLPRTPGVQAPYEEEQRSERRTGQ